MNKEMSEYCNKENNKFLERKLNRLSKCSLEFCNILCSKCVRNRKRKTHNDNKFKTLNGPYMHYQTI